MPTPPAATGGGTVNKPLTVTQLAGEIKGRLEGAFPGAVRVLGEVSNFSSRTHWYFAVKDAGAVLNCVMFAGRARSQGFVPANGQSVVVTARVDVYEPQGKLTLVAERIEPVGVGALDEAYRKLVGELRGLGWFDPERKRPLPVFPRRVAVITSRKGAALQDVLNTMARRCPAVEVCLIDCLVQGAGAASDLARAVSWVSVNAEREGIDALLVTRGGGSLEDLWAFNERAVAEAVRGCGVPVVAAIGHETDTTIAELVADARASTPTQAAMLLTPDRDALRESVRQTARRMWLGVKRDLAGARERNVWLSRRLDSAVRERVGRAGAGLSRLSVRLERARPTAMLERRRAVLEGLRVRLESVVSTRLRESRRVIAELDERLVGGEHRLLSRMRADLEGLARQLELVGPPSVLGRGYSLTLGPDGAVVRSPGQVAAGDVLTTRLAEGEVRSVVEGSSVRPAVGPRPAARPVKRKRRIDDGAGGLFG